MNKKIPSSPGSARRPAKALCLVVSVIGAVVWGGFDAGAHSGARGIVKERMTLMDTIGDSMKILAAMYKRQAPYDPALVARHSASISARARSISGLFPQGSSDHPSRALPAIWQDWPEFDQLARQLGTDSAELARMAESSDLKATRRQFARVARSCTGCHKKFRKPE